jgi:signal transduction histidine kinase
MTKVSLNNKDSRVKLIRKMNPDVPKSFEGNQMILTRVINNLLNNAVKFTHEGTIQLIVRNVILDVKKKRSI